MQLLLPPTAPLPPVDLQMNPTEMLEQLKSQLHCPVAHVTISGLSDWNTQMPRASPPSLLRQGSRVGDVHVKHTKAFEVFP